LGGSVLTGMSGILYPEFALYIALTHIEKHPSILHIQKVFPQAISTKKESYLHYE